MTDYTALSKELLRMCFVFMDLDKKTHYYGTDVPIHFAEIHLLKKIAEMPGVSVMKLSEAAGLTKGTVSPMLNRLVKKGLIEKKVSPDNQSKLCILLTEKGRQADQSHKDYHKLVERLIQEELEGASEEEVDFIHHFLRNICIKFSDLEGKL